jgi:hypothetical protein
MTPVHPAKAGTYQWKMLKRRHRAWARARNEPCYRCVERGDLEMSEIDYTAPPLSPNAYECGHRKSFKTHPWLAYVWENLGAIHSRCNRQLQDDDGEPGEWVRPDW